MPQPRRSAAYKPPRAAPVCNVPVAMDFSPTQDEPPHEQTVEQPAEAEEQMEAVEELGDRSLRWMWVKFDV